MGGCRCTYRNCSLRTDGKTHMFHYPVFDKVRCHQWLTNAHKLEFLNLKVSQLKNRVVCQHHFKDDNFMNFKKDKLTFDAVPTENGPYCDSSQLDETKPDQDECKVFSISLDDIENEYLTIVDKKANFSVKYGDFLTNCDLMDLDSLNQSSNSNQITTKGLSELAVKPNVSKGYIRPKRPARKVRTYPLINTEKRLRNSTRRIFKKSTQKEDAVCQSNITINPDNTINISKLIETKRTEDDPNSLNLILNVSEVPIEFEMSKSNDKSQENIDHSINGKVMNDSKLLKDQSINVEAIDDSKRLKDQSINVIAIDDSKLLKDQSINVEAIDDSKLLKDQSINVIAIDDSKLLKDQSINVKANDDSKLLKDQSINVKAINDPKLLNDQSFKQPKQSDKNAGRSLLKETKKIQIISEKKISEPVPLIGRLEPVSPTTILTFPNKKRLVNPDSLIKIPELPIVTSNTENSTIATDTSKDNIVLENPTSKPMDIISSRKDHVSPRVLRTEVINKISKDVLPDHVSEKVRSAEVNKTPIKYSPQMSVLKNKIPPERAAAIAEKRKFNMKLRDIVEECLDKLDEPDKSDSDKRKLSHKTKIMQSKKQQVDSYLAKNPELPSVQDYTIAYLESRIKKMEDNLLNKIGENSKKIVELKQVVIPSCEKKNIHTQTLISEDLHKRQLYQELSKYLSQEANSLIYEELFINKYAKDVPKCSSPKKRKRR